MGQFSYLNFDLSIERSGEQYVARVIDSPCGQAENFFALPFTPLELENFYLRVGRPRAGTRRYDSPEMQAAKETGMRLFKAALGGDVFASYYRSLEKAQNQDAGLRLRLRVNVPELNNLPWEFMYETRTNHFISLSVETPLVRYLNLPYPDKAPCVQLPLRMLVMISSPSDYPPLNIEGEWQKLNLALMPLVERGALQIEPIHDATLEELRRKLRKNAFHIFHFMGHGGFDELKQDGVLVLEDENNRGRPWSGQHLGHLLRDHRSLRLVVLNACEGARTGNTDPFAGTAQSLVQQGLPAVIAMQFEITDQAAVIFSQEFYTALTDGYTVDAALAEARKAIFSSGNDIEWGTPVLFTRTLEGRLFEIGKGIPEKVEPPVPVAAPEPPPAAPASQEEVSVTRLEELYQDGINAFHTRDWQSARRLLGELLDLSPVYKDAPSKYQEADKQARLDEIVQKAESAMQAKDWTGALAGWQAAANLDPRYRNTASRIEEARKQLEAERLYSQARKQAQAGDWQAVQKTFDHIYLLDPQHPDPQDLLLAARRALEGQARQRRLDETYRSALEAIGSQRWGEAERLLHEIQAAAPGYRETDALLERVVGELKTVQTAVATQKKDAIGEVNLPGGKKLSLNRRSLLLGGGGLIGVMALCGFILAILLLKDNPYGGLVVVTPTNPAATPIAHGIPGAPTLTPTKNVNPTTTQTIPGSPEITLTVVMTPTISISPTTTQVEATKEPTDTPAPELPVLIKDANGVQMGLVSAGIFLMGGTAYPNEEPIHKVYLDAFYMDIYEVTNKEYARCVKARVCNKPASDRSISREAYYGNPEFDDYPVVFVTWNDAWNYCAWRNGRLPTEAEWEKAGRGGLEGQSYPWGYGNPVCEAGAYNGAAYAGCSLNEPIKAGTFGANKYGLFDMVGNVWEWTGDLFLDNYYTSSPYSNPPGPDTGMNRVVRGCGMSVYDLSYCLSYRYDLDPRKYADWLGFRCAAPVFVE